MILGSLFMFGMTVESGKDWYAEVGYLALAGTALGLFWRTLILRGRFVLLGTVGMLLLYVPLALLPRLFLGAGTPQEFWLKVPAALLFGGAFYAPLFLVLYFGRASLLATIDRALAVVENNAGQP